MKESRESLIVSGSISKHLEEGVYKWKQVDGSGVSANIEVYTLHSLG